MAQKPRTRPTGTQEDLNNFIKELEDHQWLNTTDSFYDYCTAFKEEQQLFNKAMTLGFGIHGLKAFIRLSRKWSNYRVADALQASAVRYKTKIAELEARLEQMKQPIDRFEDKLRAHDWHWAQSDIAKTINAGRMAEGQLAIEAVEGGQAYMELFAKYWQEKFKYPLNWITLNREHPALSKAAA